MSLPSLSHFNYDSLDEHPSCKCDLCLNERKAAEAYSAFMENNPQHIWTCQCAICKKRNAIYEDLLLASTKRDTFSELSYLVQNHPERGTFLAWVWRATAKQDSAITTFSRKWWLNRGLVVTLEWWLKRWAMVSGVDMHDKKSQNA